jgi:GTP-binding protein
VNIHNAEFVTSAVKPADFIRTEKPTVAFAGKSNVGKSSVINRLLNRKNFARVGSSPGKTVHINYFDGRQDSLWTCGYGYAGYPPRVGRGVNLMEQFFAAGLITLGVMIVVPGTGQPPTTRHGGVV